MDTNSTAIRNRRWKCKRSWKGSEKTKFPRSHTNYVRKRMMKNSLLRNIFISKIFKNTHIRYRCVCHMFYNCIYMNYMCQKICKNVIWLHCSRTHWIKKKLWRLVEAIRCRIKHTHTYTLTHATTNDIYIIFRLSNTVTDTISRFVCVCPNILYPCWYNVRYACMQTPAGETINSRHQRLAWLALVGCACDAPVRYICCVW